MKYQPVPLHEIKEEAINHANELLTHMLHDDEADTDDCPDCNGTGEGQHGGLSCMSCRGRGYR